MTLTKKERQTLHRMFLEAVRDQEDFIRAYTPPFKTPRGESARQITKTKRHIVAMRKLVLKLCAPPKAGGKQ